MFQLLGTPEYLLHEAQAGFRRNFYASDRAGIDRRCLPVAEVCWTLLTLRAEFSIELEFVEPQDIGSVRAKLVSAPGGRLDGSGRLATYAG